MSNARDVVFTPPEAAAAGIDEVVSRIVNPPKLQFGTPRLDEYIVPGRAGDLIIVLGRPQNGKTMFMQHVASFTSNKLASQQARNKVILFASWEQSVEQMVMYELSKRTGISLGSIARGIITSDELTVLQGEAINQASLPVYLIGHSISRRDKRPNLTIESIFEIVNNLFDGKIVKESIEIEAIFLDYLQRMKLARPMQSTRDTFSTIVDKCKDLAFHASCPVILGCQAKRDVDDRPCKLPLMGDGQETSNIEQTGDKILSVLIPKQYYKIGDYFSIDDLGFNIGYNDMVIGVSKQKDGPSGKKFLLHASPEEGGHIRDAVVRTINL